MKSWSMLGVVGSMVLVLASAALAEQSSVEQNPFKAPSKTEAPAHEESEPAAPEKESHLPADAPTVAWTDKEIADAKAACDKALAGLAIDYQPLSPLREGLCGAPAPILVKSLGAAPKVTIDPPATITCPLAAGLVKWLDTIVQPAAREELGTQVVKLRNASSYVCRNRYGGANTPISEHALANALDVADFVFASGGDATVLNAWPRLVTAPAATDGAHGSETTGSVTPTATPVVSKHSAEAKLTKVNSNPFIAPKPSPASETKTDPVPSPTPSAQETLADKKTAFVHRVHDDACKIFGTTLGPEANEAHKNHFHLDMKARRARNFCQ